jgi:predicted metalloprotease with PDZ domain
LIFDTGAPITLINNKVAEEAGITSNQGKGGIGGGIGGLLGPVAQSTAKTFEMGDLKADNLAVAVMDHPTVSAIDKLLGPVEGIIGMSLFARYKMTIDYQAKEMTSTPVEFTPPDIMNTMMAIISNPKAPKKVLAPAGQWGFSLTKEKEDKQPGVVVKNVLPDSPAAKAGLKEGDRILTLDGRWTDTVVDCYQAASFARPGTEALVILLRDEKEMEVTVKVGAGM